jgi:Pyruvate/2-oxoacid:ferredoxin oxidoreductase delta subunit
MNWAEFLDKTLAKYDGWQQKGQISNTSKVLPIGQSVSAKQWVMPTERVELVLKNARTYALANCRCRSLGKHCERPVETCFYLNDAADKAVEKGRARRVDLAEALKQTELANEAGLVPMTIFNPEQHVLALCHCCPCCCHDLQFMMQRGREELVAHSEYVAVQDDEACLHCGVCEERCHFKARTMQEDGLAYEADKCYGCGLCVTTCPSQAISLELRANLNSAARCEA